MPVKDEISNQTAGALAGASFPIETPQDLLSGFPGGVNTACRAGGVSMSAGGAGKLLAAEDFHFKSAEGVADTILSSAGM